MELNLKKSRKLENKINEYLDDKKLEFEASVRSLSTLEEAKGSLDLKKSEFLKRLVDRENLLKTRFSIRRKIEIKNEESGVNALINMKVLTLKMISDLDSLPKSYLSSEQELSDLLKAHSLNFQNGSLEKNNIFSRNSNIKTSFEVNFLSMQDLENLNTRKLKYKKSIEEIEDKISELNMTQKIDIADDMVKLLESHKLL
jgi:hypothetical protein